MDFNAAVRSASAISERFRIPPGRNLEAIDTAGAVAVVTSVKRVGGILIFLVLSAVLQIRRVFQSSGELFVSVAGLEWCFVCKSSSGVPEFSSTISSKVSNTSSCSSGPSNSSHSA